MARTYDQLVWDFSYHAPDEKAKKLHQTVRDNCRKLATFYDAFLPEGREKELALIKIEEAMFWANAAIARHVDEEG